MFSLFVRSFVGTSGCSRTYEKKERERFFVEKKREPQNEKKDLEIASCLERKTPSCFWTYWTYRF